MNNFKIYDEIYTIGCFDYFHQGHINFFKNLSKYGDKIITGVHADNNLEKLKNLNNNEHQPIYTRINNVKKYSDVVYIIDNTDPTMCFKMIHNKSNLKQCYIRSDDNINFPGRKYVEQNMDIIFVSYTKGISSTLIRKSKK